MDKIKSSATPGSKTFSILFSLIVKVIGYFFVVIVSFLTGVFILPIILEEVIFRIVFSAVILSLMMLIIIFSQLLIQGKEKRCKQFKGNQKREMDPNTSEYVTMRLVEGIYYNIPAQLLVLLLSMIIPLIFGYIIFN